MGRILVTGARGFLGCHLTELLGNHYQTTEISAVSRRSAGPDCLSGPALDLTNMASWETLGEGFDTIFHLAAHVPRGGGDADPLASLRANLSLAENLLQACLKWRPKTLVFASSISVYPLGAGDVLREGLMPTPSDPYGVSKLVSEQILTIGRTFGVKVTGLRLSSVYGPAMPQGSVIPAFAQRIQAGEPIVLYGEGERTQDFIYVRDAARAFICAAESPNEGIFNIGSGEATTMRQLAEIMVAQAGHGRVEYDTENIEPSPSVRVDISQAKSDLGFIPEYTLDQGLKDSDGILMEG